MAANHGKDSYMGLGDSADPTTPDDISAYASSASMPFAADTAETSTFGDEAKEYVVGMHEHTFSIEGPWDPTIDARLAGLKGVQDVAFVYGPAGSTGGNVKYSGNCVLTSFETSGDIGDAARFSAEFQVTGLVSRGAF